MNPKRISLKKVAAVYKSEDSDDEAGCSGDSGDWLSIVTLESVKGSDEMHIIVPSYSSSYNLKDKYGDDGFNDIKTSSVRLVKLLEHYLIGKYCGV